MTKKFESEILRFIDQQKIPVPHGYFLNEFQNHKHYPSILALTDTFDKLGIPNTVVKVNKEQYKELPVPFLAHTVDNKKESLTMVNSFKQLHTGIYDQWDGVSILIDKTDKLLLSESRRQDIDRFKRVHFSNITVVILFALLALINLVNFSNIIFFASLLLSFFGALISAATQQKELGINSSIGDLVCSNTSKCNDVISKGKKISWLEISIADISLIYFAANTGMLLFAGVFGANYGVLTFVKLTSLLSLFAVAISLYAQAFQVRKLCRLCNLINMVLVANATTLAFMPFQQLELQQYLTCSTFYVLAAAAVVILKTRTLNYLKAIAEIKFLHKFRYDDKFFLKHLQTQPKLDAEPSANGIVLGNKKSGNLITVVCNPYCKPCALAHEQLDYLLKKYNDSLCINIQFVYDEFNDQKKEAIEYLSACMLSGKYEPQQLLHDWFAVMDLEVFKQTYTPRDPVNTLPLINQFRVWHNHSIVTHTPTVFIGKYKWPESYRISEIEEVINDLPSFIQNN